MHETPRPLTEYEIKVLRSIRGDHDLGFDKAQWPVQARLRAEGMITFGTPSLSSKGTAALAAAAGCKAAS